MEGKCNGLFLKLSSKFLSYSLLTVALLPAHWPHLETSGITRAGGGVQQKSPRSSLLSSHSQKRRAKPPEHLPEIGGPQKNYR